MKLERYEEMNLTKDQFFSITLKFIKRAEAILNSMKSDLNLPDV